MYLLMRVGDEVARRRVAGRGRHRAGIAHLSFHAAIPRRCVDAPAAASGRVGEVRRRPAHERTGVDSDRAGIHLGCDGKAAAVGNRAGGTCVRGRGINNFYGAVALAVFYLMLVWSSVDHAAGDASSCRRSPSRCWRMG